MFGDLGLYLLPGWLQDFHLALRHLYPPTGSSGVGLVHKPNASSVSPPVMLRHGGGEDYGLDLLQI